MTVAMRNRPLKSRKWAHTLPPEFPQDDWRWYDIVDAGSFKSSFNGCHDLPGGAQCDLCGTWHRYMHYLDHTDTNVTLTVGADCAAYLTGGLNCYQIEEEFIRGERRWKHDEEERLRQLAEEVDRQRRKAEELLRRQQQAEEAVRLRADQQRIAQEHAARVAAGRSARIRTVRQGIMDSIHEIAATWHHIAPPGTQEDRRHTNCWYENENGNLNRWIHCAAGYFEAGATIFGKPDGVPQRDRRFKYVLNMPHSSTIWAPCSYPTTQEAGLRAFDAFCKQLTHLVNHVPVEEWIADAWRDYIETGVCST